MPNERPTALEIVALPAQTALDRPAEALRPLVESAADRQDAELSAGTRKVYRSQIDLFGAWCREHDLCALPAPPGVVIVYLEHLIQEGHRYSSLQVALSALKYDHKRNGCRFEVTDELKRFLKGARRTLGTKKTKKKGATTEILRRMVDACDVTTPTGIRDRAMLLLLFFGAFRRSEIADRVWSDISYEDDELCVYLSHSKTDQEGAGRTVRIGITGGPYCARAALETWRAWLAKYRSNRDEYPLFVTLRDDTPHKPMYGNAIALIVKSYAQKIGENPDEFAGHSTRRGGITSLARAGVAPADIQEISGHKSVGMLAEYIESRKKAPKPLL